MAGPRTGPGPSSRRPRNAWFLFVTKVEDDFDLHIGYKNTRGDVSELSCSPPNAPVKVPFGTPTAVEYLWTEEGDEGFGELQFTSRRREEKKRPVSQLNSFEGGITAFAKMITGLVVDKKESLLALFLSLLPYSKGFGLHLEELYTDDGLSMDGSGVTELELKRQGGSLEEFKDFALAAMESSTIVIKTNWGYQAIF